MKIKKVLATEGLNGFYNDDKTAIRKGAKMDGFIYRGDPLTPGFKTIRMPGVSASIIYLLEDGSNAFGDCISVQYAAAGGREPFLPASEMVRLTMEEIAPAFESREVTTFKEMSTAIEEIQYQGGKLNSSVRYGASQAVLDAVAQVRKLTPAEVVADEYGTEISTEPIRINAQSGDDRYTNVDKMILKKAGFMPHGLINNVEEKLGKNGEIFLNYVRWVKNRIFDLGEGDYRPVFRFDVYGMIGEAFQNNVPRIVDYLGEVRKAADPLELFIEMPVDMGTKEEQFKVMGAIKKGLKERNIDVNLIIDEYANTLEEIKEWATSDACDMVQVKTADLGALHNSVEAVLYCKKVGKKVYLGGSCTETDQSARLCANIALATQPFACSGKPGMGVDEALMIINNEMQRVLAICNARRVEV
jgi:methylaspartate ammonia-lyase